MHVVKVKQIGIMMILFGVFLLGGCSFATVVPTSLPGDATRTPQPDETAATGMSTATPPPPTETNVAPATGTMDGERTATLTSAPTESMKEPVYADVLSVETSGEENAYQFAVEISSPDTGCAQYADWWEVVSEEGALLYRRILTHSHVTEQPFTRSGGPVGIRADTIVFVRAHMHPGGYGGAAFRGSVTGGFEEIRLAPDFAAGLESVAPLPTGCGF